MTKHSQLLVGILLALLANISNAASDLKITIGPYLQHVTQHSMTIMWETNIPSTSTVAYGESRFGVRFKKGEPKVAPLDQKVTDEKLVTIHELTLPKLKTQTNYFYKVISTADTAKAESAINPFQTAVREDSAFAYVVCGDNRSNPERWNKITTAALAERPNFVLNVGDVVGNGNNKAAWAKEYFHPASELMKSVPNYISIGNHERNAEWYYKYSSYPGKENYYSFDYGNAHFTVVDSNQNFSKKSGEVQLRWIAEDLARSKAKWKFVIHHHPPYSSDYDDYGNTGFSSGHLGDLNIRTLAPIYEKYGVDIVWCGHIHDYERTWPIADNKVNQKTGVIYIQTGGGAAPLEQFAPTRSWFTAKLLRNWQYCYVTIFNGTFRMMAYDIDGKLYDYLEINK